MDIEPVVQYEVPLHKWDCTITVVSVAAGIYYPLKSLCAVLGIADAQLQVERLQHRRATSGYLAKLPVRGSKGAHISWCLHRKAVGFWLAMIDERRVRPEIVERLLDFQEDVLIAAERCLFGLVTPHETPQSTGARIIRLAERLNPPAPISMPDPSDD